MAHSTFVPTFLAELPLGRRAVEYARLMHAGQRRESDDAPFILHPLEVAALLHHTGHSEQLVAAGVLHDTVEETGARLDDIGAGFGDDVAQIVATVTEDPSIVDWTERKAALRQQIARGGRDAAAIYAADKVAKVRELRARMSHDAAFARGRRDVDTRLAHYHESLVVLEDIGPDHPLVRQLRFELEALEALPPG